MPHVPRAASRFATARVERGYNAVFDAKLRSEDNATELWLTTSAEQCGRPAARSFGEEIFCEQVTRLMDAERLRENAGVQMPDFLYGTAWKEGRTAALTELALEHGFRAIDTANQRRHYFEAGVGEGIAAARLGGLVTREDLFLQTKFTYTYGQDHRLPYDPAASISDQVAQSLASSLEHLDTDRVDSFVLHGPASGGGWTEMDAEAWAAMTRERDRGRTRLLGVSNVSLRHLEQLAASGAELPRFVQNRCFARLGWDRQVRVFCLRFGITYQGFSLLTANPEALGHALIRDLASRAGATPAQIVFRFAREVRMLPVTGTSSELHMREDLASRELPMTSDEATAIESLVG